MPHVGDAMPIFNQSWQQTTQKTTVKCWLKSKCLSDSQVREGNNLLLTVDPSSDVEAEESAVDYNVAGTTHQRLLETTVIPSAFNGPSGTTLNDVASVRNAMELHKVLNASITQEFNVPELIFQLRSNSHCTIQAKKQSPVELIQLQKIQLMKV